jgi:hypothetical protein
MAWGLFGFRPNGMGSCRELDDLGLGKRKRKTDEFQVTTGKPLK